MMIAIRITAAPDEVKAKLLEDIASLLTSYANRGLQLDIELVLGPKLAEVLSMGRLYFEQRRHYYHEDKEYSSD